MAGSRTAKMPGVHEAEDGNNELEKQVMNKMDKTKYRGVAARINYLSMDRPDIQYAAKCLCRPMSFPTEGDCHKARCVARYLMNRPRAALWFPMEEMKHELDGYGDSDWAGTKSSMKSTSGGVVLWGRAALKSWSITQSTVALSSAEAELYAVSKEARQTVSIISIAANFDINLTGNVHSDSTAALGIAYRRGLGGKTRHVRVQYLWLQDKVAEKLLTINKVDGTRNPTELLTEYLPSELLDRDTFSLGVRFYNNAKMRMHSNNLNCMQALAARARAFSKHGAIASDLEKQLRKDTSNWFNVFCYSE